MGIGNDWNEGQFVIYGGMELCRIDGIVQKSPDGKRQLNYFQLSPVNSGNSAYFVLEEKIGERCRPLLSKEEIDSVIDLMPSIESDWIHNRNERKNTFSAALRSNDYTQLLTIIKSLDSEKEKRVSFGKSLMAADERVLSTARSLMFSEFSIVLGIPEEQVGEYIDRRLGITESSE